MKKKYRITEIAHPQYPWLHRIQVLMDVNTHVKAGDLGGFVQSEENLTQDGECWVYDDAICGEEAIVNGNAGLHDGSMARGSAYISGSAQLFEQAMAEENSYMNAGELKDHARLAGDGMVCAAENGHSPLIGGHSNVYGSVGGFVHCKDDILPGEKLHNPTEDMIILENGTRSVLVRVRQLKATEGYETQKKRQKKESER